MYVYLSIRAHQLTLLRGRDPEYIELNVRFTADAAIGGMILTLFPDLLKP